MKRFEMYGENYRKAIAGFDDYCAQTICGDCRVRKACDDGEFEAVLAWMFEDVEL